MTDQHKNKLIGNEVQGAVQRAALRRSALHLPAQPTQPPDHTRPSSPPHKTPQTPHQPSSQKPQLSMGDVKKPNVNVLPSNLSPGYVKREPMPARRSVPERNDKRPGSSTNEPPGKKAVWPYRVTKMPKGAAADVTIFHDVTYDFFLVVMLGAVATVSDWINWAFLVYAIVILILRVPSQRMFSAALICLVIIPLATLAARPALADIYAVMTFYFLLIGLIRAMIELHGSRKKRRFL